MKRLLYITLFVFVCNIANAITNNQIADNALQSITTWVSSTEGYGIQNDGNAETLVGQCKWFVQQAIPNLGTGYYGCFQNYPGSSSVVKADLVRGDIVQLYKSSLVS